MKSWYKIDVFYIQFFTSRILGNVFKLLRNMVMEMVPDVACILIMFKPV